MDGSGEPDPVAQLRVASIDGNRSLIGTEGYRLPDFNGLRRAAGPGGDGNVIFSADGFHGFEFEIEPSARNNTIIFDQSCCCIGRIIIWGSDNVIIVRGSREGRNPINIHMFSDRGVFFFGDHSTSNTVTFEVCGDEKSIIVGEDCMFSSYIDVGTDDRHGMFEYDTGTYLNPPASVLFAPHVWVGLHATILKGVEIGFGSIVAARTVVSRSMPEMVVVGGVPGAVIRSGVTWTRAKDPTPSEQDKVRLHYDRHRSRSDG